jgi:hypothetical protein
LAERAKRPHSTGLHRILVLSKASVTESLPHAPGGRIDNPTETRAMSSESHLTDLRIYGYCVAWIPSTESKWTMEQDDEYQNLPAHYLTLDEALDRVAYLQDKGIRARALALVATPADTADEFEAARIREPE